MNGLLARLVPALALAVGLAAAASGAAPAQTSTPNALQGFSQNRDQPVKIDAATLEVRDKDKVATFGGNVHLVQGDTTLRCKTLVVFYDQDTGASTMKTATPVGPGGGNQSIRRLEAKGSVVVTQKDQTATGDNGVFDMKSNTVTLIGNVLISQGKNAIKGDRLVVNLTTGVSRVECDNNPKGQCRVQAVIEPNAGKPDGKSDGAAAAPAAGRQPARPPGGAPSGLY
jgi:lipopolysaccharide export system protein LptA